MNWLFVAEGAGVLALLYVLLRRRGMLPGSTKAGAVKVGLLPVAKTQVSYFEGTQKGPTVLLLHGFAADKEHWLPLVAPLEAAGYHVVALDLPGFGSSFRDPEAKYDATSLARLVRSFAKARDLGMFHLVGHSIGAVVATSYAYGMPVEVASLTLIEPHGLKAPVESEMDKALAKNRNPLLLASAAGYDQLLSFVTARTPQWAAAEKKRRGEALAADRAFYQQVWTDLFSGDRAHLVDMLLPEIKPRTMAVFGARSRVVSPVTAKVLEKRFEEKDSRVVVLPDCGHWPMVEKPKELAEELVAFFRAHGREESRSQVGT